MFRQIVQIRILPFDESNFHRYMITHNKEKMIINPIIIKGFDNSLRKELLFVNRITDEISMAVNPALDSQTHTTKIYNKIWDTTIIFFPPLIFKSQDKPNGNKRTKCVITPAGFSNVPVGITLYSPLFNNKRYWVITFTHSIVPTQNRALNK